MKKIIGFIICICLLLSLSIFAYATDISKIQPDSPLYITQATTQNVLVYTDGAQIIVVPYTCNPYYNYQNTNNTIETKQETPKEQTTTVTTIETNTDVDEPTNKEDINTTPTTTDKTKLAKEIFDLINEERTKVGLEKLNYNMELQNAADIRARESEEKFSHTRPDGTSCFTVVNEIDYGVVGENLIKADNPVATPTAMVNTWMNSEGHRANILNADFTETAIGIYEKNGVTYGTQIFMG